MNRTVSLKDKWYLCEYNKAVNIFDAINKNRASLPVEKNYPFTLVRKFICPKQVNDKITVFFNGEFEGLRLYSNNKEIFYESNENGVIVFDITDELKNARTVLKANFDKGRVEDFYFRVERKV